MYDRLLEFYNYRWIIIPLLIILTVFIIYKERGKKGFFLFLFPYLLYMYFVFVLPIQRISELEDSKQTGMEMAAKIKEYRKEHGYNPIYIDEVYSALKDKRGVDKEEIYYSTDALRGEEYFTLNINNNNWAMFSLRYRYKKNVFELSDSD